MSLVKRKQWMHRRGLGQNQYPGRIASHLLSLSHTIHYFMLCIVTCRYKYPGSIMFIPAGKPVPAPRVQVYPCSSLVTHGCLLRSPSPQQSRMMPQLSCTFAISDMCMRTGCICVCVLSVCVSFVCVE